MNAAAIEAGLLRACETILYGALVAGLQAALPLLTVPSVASVDWPSVVHTFIAAMLVGLLLGLKGYHGALGAPVEPSMAADPAAPAAPAAPTPAPSQVSGARPEPSAGA